MKKLCLYIIQLALFISCFVFELQGQALLSSKIEMEGVSLFKDYSDNNLYYFAPGNMNLSHESNGNPKFQLLEMRYTGTGISGDRGENRFLNMVQFTVSLENYPSSLFKNIKKKLGLNNAQFRPLPVRNLEAFVIVPLDEGKYERIGQLGSFQSESKDGLSTRSGFWTERTFTLRLDNHEAQILWDQVEHGRLALSLNYIFYADVIPGQASDFYVSGKLKLDESQKEQFQEATKIDSILKLSIVKSNAFSIAIDVKQWPDVLKKIDINEGIPPAYAALEVTCFDFANEIRPDLALKTIEIEATSVNGQTVKLDRKKFSRGQADLHTIQVRFPYAIKMDHPLKYKITEFTKEGEQVETEWKVKELWNNLLDISSDMKELGIDRRTIDIELESLDMDTSGVKNLHVAVEYLFRGEKQLQSLNFDKIDPYLLKQVSFMYDLTFPIEVTPFWNYENGETRKGIKQVLTTDDYIFIQKPDP